MRDRLTERLLIHGSPLETGVDDPLPLIDPGAAWVVTRGHIDIVAVTITREGERSDLQRTHLLRVDEGDVILGFRAPASEGNALLLGFGAAHGQVVRLPMSRLMEMANADDLASAIGDRIDRWIEAICTVCGGEMGPASAESLRPGRTSDVGPETCVQPQSGVVWLEADGAVRFLGSERRIDTNGADAMYFPIGSDAWLTACDACRVTSHAGAEVVGRRAYWRGLEAFQDTVGAVIDVQRMREREQRRQQLRAKSRASRSRLKQAFSELESVLHGSRGGRPLTLDQGNALAAACRLVAEPLGIDVREPPPAHRTVPHANPLEEIARHSRFAIRRVQLRDRWHRRDGGPLLAFVDDGETPVALLPDSPTSYRMHDVVKRTSVSVSSAVARTLTPLAFTFYPCLPDRKLGVLDLFRFAARNLRRDIVRVFALGAVAGLLALATPVAIGFVFDTIVPGAERQQIIQVTLGLVVAAFASGAFQFTRNLALIRIKHRAGNTLQAAVWERLVNLPVRFFKKYSAGDLGVRAMGVERIMQELSTATITTIISSLFSLLAAVLMFWYSPMIATVAIVLVFLASWVIVFAGVVQMRIQRQIDENHGRMAGMLLQFMHGISKLRVAAAEDRAFAQWARMFSDRMRLSLRSRVIGNNLDVFRSMLPLVLTTLIFLMMAQRIGGENAMTTGSFLAFISAFTMLVSGMLQLAYTAVDVLAVVPTYDRMRPILKAIPEVDRLRADPGVLRGRIEVSNLTFRYEPDGPVILDNVGFHADPGEFVAIVGPSGSGKSTLMRILLGFETPESGTIAYDGFDAAGLDPHKLRRQIGVVLQDGDLLPGDLFTNIVGSAVDLTHGDAWEAARLAGLADDIEQMPMGMHTVITEGASTLSGGQRQRLMIARALVTRPRLVFFDEATSALDNPTQAIVTGSLDRLRATRVVIAHRLSTVRGADRIYVVDRGRVVQEGSFAELIDRPGVFGELVKRQIA